ncbi:two-component system, LuxR family, sensor kinase FixL [Pararobbsia alpina]|uniref:trifunctional serine/threonine-protein kinase/ATP-binding protein/sensor histidine kinase n=1 Tax=Pararobbsia alpina TaxID=621374 RepID=UPI0039A779EE
MTKPLDIQWVDGDRIFARERADGNDRSQVIVVRPAAPHPHPDTLARLTHEFDLRSNLDANWALKPLELYASGSAVRLSLDDSGGVPLKSLLGRPLALTEFMLHASGIASALSQLHDAGVVHRDLKPSHVVVSSRDGRARFTGFGLASLRQRQQEAPERTSSLIGTLAYMAPEQTGHVDRTIDSRSDLYSLGVIFFEMLTGELPFSAQDPSGWVHSHITTVPSSPSERIDSVPPIVSSIVLKLLAKAPEDRYQTAGGLARDLQRCLDALENEGSIAEFALAQSDRPDRLHIPAKLYGRVRELDRLAEIARGVIRTEKRGMVLVSGPSGIGKSALVTELRRSLGSENIWFAAGKFDQYRDVPYVTLLQAVREIVRSLLGYSDGQLAVWRSRLLDALTPNGRLITEMIPELKLIIGEQESVPELEPQQSLHRFQMVFQRLLGVFSTAERPLILFVDDLQWIDTATLDYLEYALVHSDLNHLLVIGAYRSDEVGPEHPLMSKLAALQSQGVTAEDIRLAPLSIREASHLVSDALRSDRTSVATLAGRIHDKTGGNPYFVAQFLQSLAEEELLRFDHVDAIWRYDLDRIERKGFSDNVVDLMIAKLRRLPEITQRLLGRFACLGNVATIDYLSIISTLPEAEIHETLSPSLDHELVVRDGDRYCFSHDRVQEACYVQIPDAKRAEVHLGIGRLLGAYFHDKPREGDCIFDIVNQFNRCIKMIVSPENRVRLAEGNMSAARRAKASSAFKTAIGYLTLGRGLLGEAPWTTFPALTLEYELALAECEFVTGNPASARSRLDTLLEHVKDARHRSRITCLLLDVLLTLDESELAIEACLGYLRGVGIDWKAKPALADVRHEFEQVRDQFRRASFDELLAHPAMENEDVLATVELLGRLLPAAIMTDFNLYGLAACKATSLCIEHGHCDMGSVVLHYFGVTAQRLFGDFDLGVKAGNLGFALVEQRGFKRFAARTYLGHALGTLRWSAPIRDSRELLVRAIDACDQVGDLTHGLYARQNLNSDLLFEGVVLARARTDIENGLAVARDASYQYVVDNISVQLALTQNLLGLSKAFGRLDSEQFDEHHFEAYVEDGRLSFVKCWYWIRKLQARFLAGDYETAATAANVAKALIWITEPGFIEQAEYHFYAALAKAQACVTSNDEARRHTLSELVEHQQKLAMWSNSSPANFENRAALIAAEIARLEGRTQDAMAHYEAAIRSSHANAFPHNEGIANELASAFYARSGYTVIADAYLRNAYYSYLRWGAQGKVLHMERRHPQLRVVSSLSAPTHTTGTPVERLDVEAIIKSSQAISSEILLENLTDTLLRTVLEQSGANRALLVLDQEGQLTASAEARAESGQIQVRILDEALDSAAHPTPLILHAWRTGESVVISDAESELLLNAGSDGTEAGARSILCVPLQSRARLTGVLYLENTLANKVFTLDRTTTLRIIASQAATAFENARLYRDARENESRYREVQAELAHASRVATMGQLAASIAHEVNQPIAATVFNAGAALRWLHAMPPDTGEVEEILNRIVLDGRRAGDIVERIRTQIKRAPVTRLPIDIASAIHDVVALTQHESLAHQVSVTTTLDDALPLIQGDAIQLQQVVLNLVINAIEAMKDQAAGAREIAVASARHDEHFAMISVSDTGPGVADADFERIFNSFYTTKASGLGMGLSICRSIVESHGGRLWADANSPSGTCVKFTVPFSVGALDSAAGS